MGRVGQISFYDFLSQPNLQDDRQNAGNPDLVPPQSWEVEAEVGHELGPWGKTRLRGYYYKIQDIIDIIPIGDDGEGVGNLPKATQAGIESVSTINFDPIGLKGAKLDLTLGYEHTSVKDPLIGDNRPISGGRNRWANFAFRHDIPGSKIAYGVEGSYEHRVKNYFLTEVGRSWEGPWFVDLYLEHKNLFGLDVTAIVGNVFNARHRFDRFVYDGRRNENPLLYHQVNNELIGPIFSLRVKGTF